MTLGLGHAAVRELSSRTEVLWCDRVNSVRELSSQFRNIMTAAIARTPVIRCKILQFGKFQNSSSRTGGVTASIVYCYSEFPELEFANCSSRTQFANCGVTNP